MPIVQDRDGRGIVFPAQYGWATSLGERLQHDYRFRAAISARLRAQSASSEVSMGPPIDRRDLPIGSGRSVPQVYEQTTDFPTTAFPRSSVGINQTPQQSILSSQPAQILPRQTQTGGPRMALDLGSIVRSLGEQYITTRWGMPDRAIMGDGRTAPIAATPVSYPAGVGAGMVTPALAPLALAGGAARGIYGFLAGSSKAKIAAYLGGLGLALSADEIALMAADLSKVKCKRRRRRLATHSDIKDLAALSAVLGKGKLLETWVATRRI